MKSLYNEIVAGYKSSGNSLKDVFDPDSDFNKRLDRYAEAVKELSPDMEKELGKLGFKLRIKWDNPGWKQPGSEAIYEKDSKELWIGEVPGVLFEYDGKKKFFNDPDKELWDEEWEAIRWLERIVQGE